MKCPNCGAEIPVGSLYCEQCGEDIHIVPDFEPVVEYSIEQTINGIAEDIKEDKDIPDQNEELSKKTGTEGRKHWKWVMTGFFATLCLFLVLGGIFLYEYHSVPVQIEKAERCVTKKQYDRAAEHYKRALEIDESENKIGTMFALAEVYFLKNNKVEYEYLLRQIVKDENANEEQLESAYGKLIAIYKAREDYRSINDLLLASNNERILYNYQKYVALPPEFSVGEGYYADIQPLKLTAYGTGKIYYTLDGSTPDENSMQYTAPIILDDGDYVVCAYFVNEYGIASECETKTYHIEIEALPIPEVSVVSGEYNFPINIEILGDNKEVYYTTDGSEPTLSSSRYAGPIPMPLGKTNYKFIRLDGGRTSDVVERTFSLVMNTEYTPEQAAADVVAYSMQNGKIYDEEGHFDESESMYKYKYQYVTNITQIDDFYVISEFLQEADGTLTKTGSHFAVNAYTEEIFKLQINGYNNYTLVGIEEQPAKQG